MERFDIFLKTLLKAVFTNYPYDKEKEEQMLERIRLAWIAE